MATKKAAPKQTATKHTAKATKKTAKPTKGKVASTKHVAKKTTRKSVPKKSVKKAACDGACACKQTAAPDECFWVNNGPVVATLGELRVALESMSAAQYRYHTRGGNDFAQWVRDCFGADACAKKLEKATTKTRAAAALSGCCA